jgi:hypothetical protein
MAYSQPENVWNRGDLPFLSSPTAKVAKYQRPAKRAQQFSHFGNYIVRCNQPPGAADFDTQGKN